MEFILKCYIKLSFIPRLISCYFHRSRSHIYLGESGHELVKGLIISSISGSAVICKSTGGPVYKQERS